MSPYSSSSNNTAFGKVPAIGDFLRTNVHVEPTPTFEAWITEGMAIADERLGPRFQQAYLQGAIHAFVFRAPKGQHPQRLLAGVIRPSRDSVGRRFPMVIATTFETAHVASHPNLLPLVLGDFLESATEMASAVDHVRSQGELEAYLQRVHSLRFDGLESAYREYGQWTQATPLVTAWGAIYGASAPIASLHALHTILEAVAAFRGKENPSTTLGFRFPLGGGGPAAAAFWIDLVRTAAKWRATVPTCFWSFDGRSGDLLLHLGDPHLSSVAQLWVPDPDSDHICDMTSTRSVDPNRIVASLPRPVAEVAQRGDVAVAHLLAALASA